MSKLLLSILVLTSVGLAQSSSDGSFSVRNSKHPQSFLSEAQMHEAESLYQSSCTVVQKEFHSTTELHPRFIVVVGMEHNEVHAAGIQVSDGLEIWMKKWNPTTFAQGVVILAFQQLLTRDAITQLGNRAVSYSNATIDVARLK
jgi:hypothetical protein